MYNNFVIAVLTSLSITFLFPSSDSPCLYCAIKTYKQTIKIPMDFSMYSNMETSYSFWWHHILQINTVVIFVMPQVTVALSQ